MLPLRGLHLPTTGPATELGDIALAIAGGLAAALLIGSLLGVLLERRRSVRQAAMNILHEMRQLAPADRMVAQATLLRRLVRTLHGDAAARRQGEEWLQQLDGTFRTDFFTCRAGRSYVDALYQKDRDPDVNALHLELAKLFERIRR